MGLLDDLAFVPITIAKPETLLEWSFGEVKKPEHVCSYNTFKREKEELFLDYVFGFSKEKAE